MGCSASIRGHAMSIVRLITIAGTIAIITTTTTTDRSGKKNGARPFDMREGGDCATSIILPLEFVTNNFEDMYDM